MSNTKVKISFIDGTSIELEGSESFVEKHWSEIKETLESTPKPRVGFVRKAPKTKPAKKTKNTKSKKVDLKLIPLNLKGGSGKPSLKDFVTQKSPRSQQELVTVQAYYLKKYLNIQSMKPGHALYCYNEIGKKKPLEIIQLYRDITSRKGWLGPGDEPNTAKITIGGENLVEQDLPKKKK